MTVLVAGGSGFIGSHIVKKFLNADIPLIITDIREADFPHIPQMKIDIINDVEALTSIMTSNNVTAVIHLVGFPNVADCEKDPMTSFKINTLSTQSIVESMRKSDVEKILFASSAAVYGYKINGKVSEETEPRPDTIYGFHKLFSEQIIKSYAERYGIKFVILRLFNVFGGDPTLRTDVISLFIKQALNKKPLTVFGPNKYRDFIYIEDVAHAFLISYQSKVENTIFNIGSGNKITLQELVSIFKEINPQIQVITKESPDDGTGIYADITLAKNLLGFNPRSPREAIRDYIQRFLSPSSS
jgi:UDP-glucose 4-epimerase